MAERELISPNGDKRYVRHDDEGRFSESDDVGRSLAADRRQNKTGNDISKSHKLVFLNMIGKMVGVTRFELATPCTPCKCATRLRYTPTTGR